MALTPKQEAFAQAIVTGVNQSDAVHEFYAHQRQAVDASMGSMRAFYDDRCAFLRGIAEGAI